MIPKVSAKCYYMETVDCSGHKDRMKIAEKDTEYCDLGAYLNAGKYTTGNQKWTDGFFGDVSGAKVKLGSHTYHLDGSDNRRLAGGGNAGKTTFDDYTTCLEEMCGYKRAINCAETPDIFTLLGHTGVALMIFESGLHFDFDQAKTVGPWACVVAVFGTFLPIISGTLLAVAYGFPWNPDGLAVGVSLAPTSVGIALKLLHEARALQTDFGQSVMTAAFVDDVLSLIVFSVLFQLQGEMTFEAFLPLIAGIVFMVVAIIAAVKVWPPLLRAFFDRIPEDKADAKLKRHDEIWFPLMFTVLVAYAVITHYCGTHLWGCFIAGMSFSSFPHAHHVWSRQVKRVTVWLLRIFFACTLAWSIPVDSLFTWDALGKGTLMGLGPCILAKVLSGPFMGKTKWVIGWAMVGRAEFAYFIAIMANSLKMMNDELFAILVWALIYATIFAPLVFRKVLNKYLADQEKSGRKSREISMSAMRSSRVSGHALPNRFQEEQDEAQLREFEQTQQKIQALEAENAELKAKVGTVDDPKDFAEV
jgi:Kef-type K+ transport system membrane component KefB